MYHYFCRILPNAIFFWVAIYESTFIMAPDVQSSPNWESQVCYSTVYLETGERVKASLTVAPWIAAMPCDMLLVKTRIA